MSVTDQYESAAKIDGWYETGEQHLLCPAPKDCAVFAGRVFAAVRKRKELAGDGSE